MIGTETIAYFLRMRRSPTEPTGSRFSTGQINQKNCCSREVFRKKQLASNWISRENMKNQPLLSEIRWSSCTKLLDSYLQTWNF